MRACIPGDAARGPAVLNTSRPFSAALRSRADVPTFFSPLRQSHQRHMTNPKEFIKRDGLNGLTGNGS